MIAFAFEIRSAGPQIVTHDARGKAVPASAFRNQTFRHRDRLLEELHQIVMSLATLLAVRQGACYFERFSVGALEEFIDFVKQAFRWWLGRDRLVRRRSKSRAKELPRSALECLSHEISAAVPPAV